MTAYTLAGPDFGVKRLSFAELCQEIGDDAALDATDAVKDGKVHQLPGQDPHRILRLHKAGDEALGFEYFARKAGLAPEDRRRDTPNVETPQEARQGMFARKANDAGMYCAVVTVTTTSQARVWIAAKDQAEANAALDAYINDRPPPEGFEGNLNFPTAEIATASHRALVKAQGNFEEAGWQIAVQEKARPASDGEMASFLTNIMVEQRVHEHLASMA